MCIPSHERILAIVFKAVAALQSLRIASTIKKRSPSALSNYQKIESHRGLPRQLQALVVPTHRRDAVTAPYPRIDRDDYKPTYTEGDAQADGAVAVMLA